MKNSKKSNIEIFVINKVKEKRIEFGYSQAELAYRMNLSPGFIGMVESKKYQTKYNINHINILSMIFNCSPQDFLPTNYLEENGNSKNY